MPAKLIANIVKNIPSSLLISSRRLTSSTATQTQPESPTSQPIPARTWLSRVAHAPPVVTLLILIDCWAHLARKVAAMFKRNNPESFILINSILVPLLVTYFAEVGSMKSSKKLYVAYDTGPFFSLNAGPEYQDIKMPDNFIDIHDGNTTILNEVYASSKAVVLMSYAPWSINCLDAIPVFLQLASLYQTEYELNADEDNSRSSDRVYVVGINCWLPKSECRRGSRGLGPFPRIVLYIPESGRHVRYSGPVTTLAIKRELERLMEPYRVMVSVGELRRALTGHPSSLVLLLSNQTMSSGLRREDLHLLLDSVFTLGMRLSSLVQYSHWSVPQLLVVSNYHLKLHLCTTDCAFNIPECDVLLESDSVLLYRSQKVLKFAQLRKELNLDLQLWSLVRLLFAPRLSENIWRENPMSFVNTPSALSVPSVEPRLIGGLNGVLAQLSDFTLVLNSNNASLIKDFVSVKFLVEKCKKHFKKLHCASIVMNKMNDSRFCRICSKHSNVSKLIDVFERADNSTLIQQYLAVSLKRFAQLFCYSRLKDLEAASALVEEDILYQHQITYLHTGLFGPKADERLDEAFSLSVCQHNKTIAFAVSSNYKSCDEKCPNSSYLTVYDRANGQSVFKVPSIGSTEDIISIISDLIKQSYYILTEKSQLYLKPQQHFLHSNLRNDSLIDRKSTNSDRRSNSLPEMINSLSSSCKSRDIWSGNNSNNCLVLHYNSWCGFCKTVLHVFHTVGNMMTQSFPNMTDFVKVNSGLENVPSNHKVSKFPTIVFYPGAGSSAHQHKVIAAKVRSKRGQSSYDANATFVYPDDVAITVPNLYGFVRLHTGVY